jgi:hypothetical protein
MPSAKQKEPASSSLKLHGSRKTFVDGRVKETPVTKALIDRIAPSFPVSAKVISGYLTPADLYWKVNYHWELLLGAIDEALSLPIDEAHKTVLTGLRAELMGNPPNPVKGYWKRGREKIGEPKDRSAEAKIIKRHALLRRVKARFRVIVRAARIVEKTSWKTKAIQLSYEPVALPSQGAHAKGYALDISGDNKVITEIALALGATVVLDEGNHVHCEWAQGVDTRAQGDRGQAA